MTRAKTPIRQWSGIEVFVAATVASRINDGEYIKQGAVIPAPTEDNPYGVVPHPKTPNRVLMEAILTDSPSSPEVTEQDRADADSMRQHYQGLYFKVLGGKILSEFESTIMSLANAEEITERQLNWIASLPSAWKREVRRQSVQERIDSCAKSYAGPVGSKISTTAEIVRCVFSQTWNTFYATAITKDNMALFFSAKNQLTVGSTVRIEGKIKSHRDGFQTQLNYTKVF